LFIVIIWHQNHLKHVDNKMVGQLYIMDNIHHGCIFLKFLMKQYMAVNGERISSHVLNIH